MAEVTGTSAAAGRGRAVDGVAAVDPAAGRVTPLLLMTAVVSAISALLYGYDTGVISGALLQIRRDFHTSSGTEQVIAGSILFGAVLGALTCSHLSEPGCTADVGVLISV